MKSSDHNQKDCATALERLRMTYGRGTLSHSLLFIGNRGWGKRTLAKDFARILFCEQHSGSEACACRSCSKVNSNQHPDLKWFGEDEDKRSIGIAEVRELLNWMSLKPFEGNNKVAVLPSAERLTTDAANAMLKLLEEPPQGSYLVLLTEHFRLMLSTIRSRCMLIKLKPIPREKIMQALKAKGLDSAEASFLARKSEGSLRRALELHEKGLRESRNALVDVYLDKGIQPLFGDWSKLKRLELIEGIRELRSWLRDALILALTDSDRFIVNNDVISKLKLTAEEGPRRLQEKLKNLIEIERALDANVNQKLALTRLEMLFAP